MFLFHKRCASSGSGTTARRGPTLEQLSNQDLADMGIKRYQLGHVARVQVLGRADGPERLPHPTRPAAHSHPTSWQNAQRPQGAKQASLRLSAVAAKGCTKRVALPHCAVLPKRRGKAGAFAVPPICVRKVQISTCFGCSLAGHEAVSKEKSWQQQIRLNRACQAAMRRPCSNWQQKKNRPTRSAPISPRSRSCFQVRPNCSGWCARRSSPRKTSRQRSKPLPRRLASAGLAANFVQLLARNRRLPALEGAIISLSADGGRSDAAKWSPMSSSAEKLTAQQIKDLKAALKASIGRDVQLERQGGQVHSRRPDRQGRLQDDGQLAQDKTSKPQDCNEGDRLMDIRAAEISTILKKQIKDFGNEAAGFGNRPGALRR